MVLYCGYYVLTVLCGYFGLFIPPHDSLPVARRGSQALTLQRFTPKCT